MIVRESKQSDLREIISIAKELKEWFTKEAVENMKIDFKINNCVVATDLNKIVGFAFYFSEYGKIKIIWLGVKKNNQRKGVGFALVKWIENVAKKCGSKCLEVETLTEEDDYVPYKLTRAFYYKNGFKKMYTKRAVKEGWDDVDVLEKKIA